MPELEPTLEIERIKNLIINFDWLVVKQEITETSIILTISKSKPSSIKPEAVGAD